MTKENQNRIFVLVVVVAIIIILFVVIKKIKDSFVSLKNETNDIVANSPLGQIIGNRTVAAENAFSKMMKMPFMKHTWITKANAKYNTAAYQMPEHLTTQQATDYARDLKASKSILSTDYTNDNNRALATLMTLRNWVEVAQVAEAYYNTGSPKDLNRGLAWMSNDALVEAADYLSSLPTGVYQYGAQLSKDSITV